MINIICKLLKVIGEILKHNNINIVSSDIIGKGAPSAIVFDPQTSTLTHAVPCKKEKDTHKRIARLNTSNSKFNLGFDLTASEPKKEIVFNQDEIQQLSNLYDYHMRNTYLDPHTATTAISPIKKTLEEIDPNFVRDCDPNYKKILELGVNSINERINNKGYDYKKLNQLLPQLNQLSEKIADALYKNNPNDTEENINKNINKILDKALIVKKGGLFSLFKSSISVELEDKKIFPPEFSDKNKDPQASDFKITLYQGFKELEIYENYLDKKGDPQQIRGNFLSKDSSTLSHSQSTDKENISISSESNVGSRNAADRMRKTFKSPESLTHLPSVKPKHKSQQI